MGQIKAPKMGFPQSVGGIFFRDKVSSSDILEGLGVEPLLLRIEGSQFRWFRQLVRMLRGKPRTRWGDYIYSLAWEPP